MTGLRGSVLMLVGGALVASGYALQVLGLAAVVLGATAAQTQKAGVPRGEPASARGSSA